MDYAGEGSVGPVRAGRSHVRAGESQRRADPGDFGSAPDS